MGENEPQVVANSDLAWFCKIYIGNQYALLHTNKEAVGHVVLVFPIISLRDPMTFEVC